jgi:predicted transglutaminase-like cysteine proteinase
VKCEECSAEVTFEDSNQWCSENQYQRCCNDCYYKIVEETKAEVAKLITANKVVNTEVKKTEDVNCWSCKFQKDNEGSFFGYCHYFAEIGKEPKEIPSLLADKGCEYYGSK